MKYTYDQIEQILGYKFGLGAFYEICSHLPTATYNDVKSRNVLRKIFDDYIGGDDEQFDELPENLFFNVVRMQTAPDGTEDLIVYFSFCDVYIRINGWYDSYGSAELDMYQVYPVDEVVTNYYA